MNKMNFGKRVREVRKKQDLTSEKLAEICEISPVYVRQIECSARTPSLLVFIKLCNGLYVSADYLLQESLKVQK